MKLHFLQLFEVKAHATIGRGMKSAAGETLIVSAHVGCGAESEVRILHAEVDESRYLGRGPHWHGPQPHRVRVRNLLVMGHPDL